MIKSSRIVIGYFVLICLYGAISKAGAIDSILVSESASWAWFGSANNNGSIEVLIAGYNIIRPEEYANKPDEYKVVRIHAPLSNIQELKRLASMEPPFSGKTVELLKYKYSDTLSKKRMEKLPILLPCLHPDSSFPLMHTGDGTELSGGDMPSWEFWRSSRVFQINEDAWFLVDRHLQAFISSTKDHDRSKYRRNFKSIAFPKRIQDNPFSESATLEDAFHLGNGILLISNSGKKRIYGLAPKPEWNADDEIHDLPGVKQKVFIDPDGLFCLSQDDNRKWKIYSSRKGSNWHFDSILPLEDDMHPLLVTKRYLIAIKENKSRSLFDTGGFNLYGWKLNADATYKPSHSFYMKEGLFMDVVLGESNALYCLIGTKGQKENDLSVSLRMIAETLDK